MKENIKEFMNMQSNSKVTVERVNSYTISEFDDDYGAIGENYIVKFEGFLIAEKSNGTVTSTSKVEYKNSTAYVNIKEFKKWLLKETAVQYEFDHD